MMGRAAKETTSDSDWDSYGWENDVEVQGHKPVDAKEAEQYRIFDALPLLPNADFCRDGVVGPATSGPVFKRTQGYQPKTGVKCSCKKGVQRDNCPACEGTGMMIDFAAIRARNKPQP